MARAMWKATLVLDGARVPVKLYSAVEDRAVRFHLLHEPDKVRIRQHMLNPNTGEEVPSESIRKGAEIARGQYVLLEEKERVSTRRSASFSLVRGM